MTKIHLGFEVGTGAPVAIPLRHMVVTGQTQEAGKTTTLEALIARAQLPAVAFITKRGERSFETGRRVQPYFRERADWQFVAAILEATMREKLKFERAWIMRASKGAKSLADVQANVQAAMASAKGLNADVYMTLNEYLEIVVPRIAKVRFANKLDLEPGINVLDLADRERFPHELQALVMRSSLEWIYEKCDGTIAIIPEAWEFLPQERGSPVKMAATELIRKGAGLHNYVWLDSQDIGGVDKVMLRSCPVWLLGVQREANEIKRVLENIPAGIAKPKPGEVATLKKGQFFACFGERVIKTYVQPAWMTEADAIKVAKGALALDQVSQAKRPKPTKTKEDTMTPNQEEKLDRILDFIHRGAAAQAAVSAAVQVAPPAVAQPPSAMPGSVDEEGLYQRFKARLAKESPMLIKVLSIKPEIKIEEKRETVEVDLKGARGMVAKLLSEGFLDKAITATLVWKEVKRRWNYGGISARIYEQLDWFTSAGFVTKESDGYQAVPGMKSNIKGS
jgi:hypothetical protein